MEGQTSLCNPSDGIGNILEVVRPLCIYGSSNWQCQPPGPGGPGGILALRPFC